VLLSIFFFVDLMIIFPILALFMARTYVSRRTSTLALRQRKRHLLSQVQVEPQIIRASFVERFSVCGKPQCHCHQDGQKHGPFYYLTQCLSAGKVNKFLLKTLAEQHTAKTAVEKYRLLQEQLEELSQINTELLRRGEALEDAAR
jgi:hypothetical protein